MHPLDATTQPHVINICKRSAIDLLGPEDLIITPNQRLANTLKKEIEAYQLAQTEEVFRTPLILSFTQWAEHLWKSYLFIEPKKYLSAQEENWLWRKIAHTIKNNELLNLFQTIKLAQTAWHHLIHWQVTLEKLKKENSDNENVDFFIFLAECFKTRCKEENWIDESSAVARYVNDKDFLKTLPYANIYWYHFIELTPLQENLIENLKHNNKSVMMLDPSMLNKTTHRVISESTSDEMMEMAIWAKEKHDQNPDTTIGCVVFNLHQQRDEVLRFFKQAFASDNPPIDISAGYRLSEFTLIQHMLLLISLQTNMFDYEIFSAYLRSAYNEDAENLLNERHELDLWLRERVNKKTSLEKIVSLLMTEPKLYEAHHAYLNKIKFSMPSGALPLPLWCQHWLDFLKGIGWPGQRNLNSTEYQVSKRFITLLEELEAFSSLQFLWTWQEFSHELNILCHDTIFQPEKDKTRIQVLGLLEASGMSFQHLWIMGLHDKNWPSHPSPNPLLPYHLQKTLGFPHASAEREYDFCQRLQHQLINSSEEVTLSYAAYDIDIKSRPSPLIVAFPMLAKQPKEKKQHISPATFEQLHDDQSPPCEDEECLRGGTSLVQSQALCPFKTFAHFRLHAKPMEKPRESKNALIRGQQVHRALELFWKKIKNSDELHRLTEKQLSEIIEDIVANTHQDIPCANDFLAAIEKIQLHRLLQQWMNTEKERHHFCVIATEQTQEYRYKNIKLRLRIDRIDETAEGEYIIIDYKTSIPHVTDWFGERIKEPQLPLYLISGPDNISTLSFAKIRWNDCEMMGISHEDTQLASITPFHKFSHTYRAESWEKQRHHWKNSIDQLLEAYLQGDARVDPLDVSACQYCALPSLCRIFEHER